jgi:U3 small nucleolar RNA-associated protein 4
MDIHRSRFVAYPSSAINALAFSRSSDKNYTDPRPALKLALGRANGDIEIWSADKGDWVQESVFPGGSKRSVDALAWIQEPDDTDYEGHTILGQLRLFSIGSTAAVTEWDLTTGKELRSSTGNFSEVWCFAAQPRWRPSKSSREDEFRGQNLVAGTGDGTLAILSTDENDLVFKRFLARGGNRKTRCMSVTWKDRDTVVAGFTDSTIRIYDARNGSLLRNLSLGAGVPGAPRDTLVWKVRCLPNGDIVSGDSNGQLKFWDGRTYTLSQSVSGHDSDCLDLVSSTDGTTVFSGGMDGRIAVYKLGGKEGDKRRWAKTSHRRMHEGDIKAMAVYDSKHMSVVLSGGASIYESPLFIMLTSTRSRYHTLCHPATQLQQGEPPQTSWSTAEPRPCFLPATAYACQLG